MSVRDFLGPFYVRTLVGMVENKISLSRDLLSLLQSQWLLDPLIERKLPVMSDFHDCLDECDNVRSTLTNHQKMMVFSSSLLKEILSNSKESTPDSKSEVVTRDCFLRLLLETNWVRHWCICVLGYSDSTEVTSVEFRNSPDSRNLVRC